MIPPRLVRLFWVIALAALCIIIALVNSPKMARNDSIVALSETDGTPEGHEIGERVPDFSLTQTDGEVFRLNECRGKVTVLNLWATWCTPCINELPYFERLQKTYAEKVAVLAIHSNMITDDVQKYLSQFDYEMCFAIDEDGSVTALLGGSSMLPQTVVLDRYGIVTYNNIGSVTYEALEQLVQAAMVAG